MSGKIHRRFLPGLFLICILMSGLLLVSCAGEGFQIIENEQTGVTVYRLSGVYVDMNRRVGGMYAQVDFGAERREEKHPADTSFALYAAPLVLGGLHVVKGDPLELVIDGDTVTIACARVRAAKGGVQMGSPLTGRGTYYLETLRYEVERTLLQRLAFAASVTYTIHGRSKSLSGSFTEGNLKRFRAFYQKYVF